MAFDTTYIPNFVNRTGIDNYISSIRGKYAPSDVNSIAQRLSDNAGGVSFQELQGALQPGALTTQGSQGPAKTTAAASSVDPATVAFLNSQIGNVNTQIGVLDPQLQAGLDNITNSYNSGVNKENDAFGRAERDYGTNKNNTIQDELSAKRNIDSGVRSNTNAIQRLLGLSGSGNSSASQVLAPFAANRVGDIQRSGVQTSYGRNIQGLDTAWGDTQSSHKENLNDLTNQQFSNQNSLKSGIANTRASLLQTLAGLTLQRDQASGKTLGAATADAQPYLNQVNDIVKGAAGLSSQYANPISLASPSVYKAPTLDSYNYGSTGAPTVGGGNNSGDTILAPLFGTPQRKSLLGV